MQYIVKYTAACCMSEYYICIIIHVHVYMESIGSTQAITGLLCSLVTEPSSPQPGSI